MTEEDKIRQVLYQYEESGLVTKDIDQVLSLVSDRVIGIGIGEQGYVTSKADIIDVFEQGLKELDHVTHRVDYDRIEVLKLTEDTAVVCAGVIVTAETQGRVTHSRFSQSLTLVREQGEWRICCLHASAPVVTEENIEAYPLRFAEKTLTSLREKIGEEVYVVEEQYRMAILRDTLASYIINITTDTVEKCQLNGSLCIYIEPGKPYESTVRELIASYVVEEDREKYLRHFSRENIFRAFDQRENEVQFEYRMYTDQGGSFIWVVSIIRLITDIVTGERKGIMYVKNIDSEKRQELAMQQKADSDDMLKIYNKGAFIERVTQHLSQGGGVFVMLDIDDFKSINDSYGHPFGDKVLTRVAGIMKDIFPKEAVLGRLGGDEFGVFLPEDRSQEQIEGYMDSLFGHMDGFCLEDGRSVWVSCSAGITCAGTTRDFKQIYEAADQALYRSKQSGKKRYTFYVP